MSDPVASTETVEAPMDWAAANLRYLGAQLERMRLLLKLRAHGLRKQWRRELDQIPSGFQSLVISDAEADALLEWGSESENNASPFGTGEERDVLDRLDEQQQRINEARDLFAGGTPPAFEILTRLFHLGHLEQDILLMCLAPELDSRFERLYAYLQDDVARSYPTAALMQGVLTSDLSAELGASELRVALSASSPLRRYRLLNADAGVTANWCQEPLRVDRRVGDYILGVNHPDEQMETLTRPVTGTFLLDSAGNELAQQLDQRLRAWPDPHRHPVIQVVAASGNSPRAVARELCSRLGFSLYSLDYPQLALPPGERQAAYRLLERESLLLSCGYFIDASQIDRGEPTATNALRDVLQELRALLIVATREPFSLERSQIIVRLQKTGSEEQLQVWRNELQDAGASEEFLAKIVSQFSFAPQQVRSIIATAREAATLHDPQSPAVTSANLWRAARDHAACSMQSLAQRIEPHRAFEDLILPPEQMQQLRDIALQVEHRSRVYEGWGFGAKMSRGKGISALFSGPSGTGKTMAAEVLAGYLDLDLFRIDLAGVVSKYIGETEKNLRRLFDAAEESGAILFFDEADALFGKRSEVRDSHDRYANIEINYLLQRMEDYRGLAILATNRKSLLDPAFLRRLRFLVEFPFPAAADRARIWKTIFPKQAAVDALDYEFLGRLEIAGGNISNIALNAAFRASSENSSVNLRHVLAAARREYDKIDKLVLESEFGPYYSAVRR